MRLPQLPVSAVLFAPPTLSLPAAALPNVSAVAPAQPTEPTASAQLGQISESAALAPQTGDVAASALSAQRFDGAAPNAAVASAALGESGSSQPALPSFLAAADPEAGRWLSTVVATMSRSKTARAVLRKVAQQAERRGRPLVIAIAQISGASGLFSFDHGVVTIGSNLQSGASLDTAAGVLTHELKHALQFEEDLPVMAFEMELEAFLAEFHVYEELGYKAPRESLDYSSLVRFKNDADRFIVWLNKEYYPEDLAIIGHGAGDYEERLRSARATLQRGLRWFEGRLKKVDAVIERMRQTGQPEQAIEQYRLDEAAPLQAKIRLKLREIGWLDHDLALLSDPVARQRYKKYAARVLRQARAYHRSLSER